jgi:putative flippase GtrA
MKTIGLFLTEFVKFGLVGASGFCIDMTVVVISKEFLKLPTLLCGILGYMCAVTWNFVLNSIWTFKNKNKNIAKGYFLFLSICSIGLLIRLVIMKSIMVLFPLLDDAQYGYVAINICGIAGAVLFNFLGSKFLVFKKGL